MYLSEVLSQDETTQRDGLVGVLYPTVGMRDALMMASHHQEDTRFVQSMPFRNSALHLVFPIHSSESENETGGSSNGSNNAMMGRIVQALFLIRMVTDMRRVTRIHTGEKYPMFSYFFFCRSSCAKRQQ